MLYILLSKQILSVFFILHVLLEAWDSWVFFKKKEINGYYLNKHIAFIPFWNEAKYISIAWWLRKEILIIHSLTQQPFTSRPEITFILSQVTGTVWWKLDEAY